MNEAHRVSSISWDKFYRRIRVELSKPPNERQNIYDFLKACTEEFDRLMETSPTIEKQVIMLFNETFNSANLDENKKQLFQQLKKPEICDSLESVQLSIFKEDDSMKKQFNFKQLVKDAVDDVKQHSEKHVNDVKNKIIEEFVNNFKDEMLRYPTKEELINNLVSDELKIGIELVELYMKLNMELTNDQEADIENNIQNASL